MSILNSIVPLLVLVVLTSPHSAWADVPGRGEARLPDPLPQGTGTIAGTVTKQADASPIAGVTVMIRVGGTTVASPVTDASGRYTASALPPNSYVVATSNSLGYVEQSYPGTECYGGSSTACDGTPVTVQAGSTLTNIDFALGLGGFISGTFNTAEGTGVVSFGSASIYTAAGSLVERVDVSGGSYANRWPLPPGNYYVRGRSGEFVGQIYAGKNCYDYGCLVTSGTPVPVTRGATTAGINFTFHSGAQMRGTVRSAESGGGLYGIVVSIYDASGQLVLSTQTDGNGAYSAGYIDAGTYYVATTGAASRGYFDQLYNGATCGVTCPPVTTGTALTLALYQWKTDVNFSLTQAVGSIAGLVTNAAGGSILPGIDVLVYNASGTYVGTAQTDMSGVYRTTFDLPSGTYYVRTSSTSEYLAQLFAGVNCGLSCPAVTSGTPVSVTVGRTTRGIDFPVSRGAVFAGRVTSVSNGAGVSGVPVRVYTAGGSVVATATTDGTGAYGTPGVPGGTYFVATDPSGYYFGQLYPGVNCTTACSSSLAMGSSITVETGAWRYPIDFSLGTGAVFTGRVSSAVNGSALAAIPVRVLDYFGKTVWFGASDETGVFRTTPITSGGRFVVTDAANGYIGGIYQSGICIASVCPMGTVVSGFPGQTVSGIDLALYPGGGAAGRVTYADTGAPAAGVPVTFFGAYGTAAGSVTTDADGVYGTALTLPAGTWYIGIPQPPTPYLGQIFSGHACEVRWCSVTDATPVTVVAGQIRSSIDLALVRSGAISGHVTASSGGTPLEGVTVSIITSGGASAASAQTDASGAYTTTTPLPPGTYYASVNAPAGYLHQVYAGVSCGSACPSPTTVTPIAVANSTTTSGIDFALVRGGVVSGRVTDARASTPLAGVAVTVYARTGAAIAWATSGSDGTYTASGTLETGTYFVQASPPTGHVGQLYLGVNCGATCPSPPTGTPVSVTQAATTPGIDFALLEAGSISGRVTSMIGGAPVIGAVVVAFDASGRWVQSATSDHTGAYTISAKLPTGSYFVRIADPPGHVGQLYQGIACAPCIVTAGTPVAVTAPATTVAIDFVLSPKLPAFFDDPLVPGKTPVRVRHIAQLREAVETLRAWHSLPASSWTDPEFTPGITPVKAAHVVELRDALTAVYRQLGRDVPTWSTPTIVGGASTIAAHDISELRAAVIAIW